MFRKNFIARFLLRRMVKLVFSASDRNIIRALKIFDKFMLTPRGHEYVRYGIRLFEQKAPPLQLAKRLITQTSPTCRDALVNNFFINAIVLGARQRQRYEKERGVRPPFFIVMSPTMRCNLRCYGCYAGEYEKEPELSFEIMDRVIREGKEMGIYFYTISGGEPFVWRDLLSLFEKHNDCAFQIYTNGTLIDREMANRLVKLGNVAPAISVEGFREQTEERRGKGIYQRIMEAMDALQEEGAVFGFSATATRYNIDLLSREEFIEHYIAKGCSFGWYFIYIPIGRLPNLDLMPSPEQRNQLRERLSVIKLKKPIFIGDFWNDGSLVGGCISGGRRYFHINSKGDVEPCVFVHFAVDNIKNKSLEEVLKSPFFTEIKKRQPFNENHLMPCMIIDNPQILREVVKISGAYPTHEGAASILEEFAPHLDTYARQMKQVVSPHK